MEETMLVLNKEKDPEPECKGVYFRGIINEFVTDTRMVRSVEVRLLKSKSCKGCAKCSHFFDDASESLGWSGLALDNIQHGKLYRAKTIVDSIDCASRYADEWHTGFVEVATTTEGET